MNVKNLCSPLLLNIGTIACGQNEGGYNKASETDYFRDVTAEQLPTDSTAHILDVALADVDKDGDLDALLALENQSNRMYLNDGNGIFTWKKKYLPTNLMIQNTCVWRISIRMVM